MSAFCSQSYIKMLDGLDTVRYCGTVSQLIGLAIESVGP